MPRLFFVLVASAALFAQTPAPMPTSGKPTREGAEYVAAAATTPVAKVIAEIRDHQQAVSNLQYLCDEIGPRLTGSERLVEAHDWMEAQMKAYGLADVHREAYDFGRSWTRGVGTARIIGHNGLNLQ